MGLKVLPPIKITAAMVTACIVAEPDVARGEVEWSAAEAAVIGMERVRSSTHRVYTALASGVDAGLPENTPLRWRDTRPTNKYLAFDNYRSTAIRYHGTLTMTVKPGIITDMWFYGLEGDTIRVVCKNATSGTVYKDTGVVSLALWLSGDLEWEFWFGTPRQQDQFGVTNLYPTDAQVEVTITPSLDTGWAGIGIWVLGSFYEMGDPQFGFKAKPVDFSYIDINSAGEAEIKKGLTAKDLVGSCVINSDEANAIVEQAMAFLGIPVAVIMDAARKYDYLSTFGLLTAEVPAENDGEATVAVNARGLI
jgi:hypothetical protein